MHCPRFGLCRRYICIVGSYWHAITYYREAADDPNSRVSSQTSRKDKEAGISTQCFSQWQFKEHKRREKEKVMAILVCIDFLSLLSFSYLSICGSWSFWGLTNHCEFWWDLVHLKKNSEFIVPVILRFRPWPRPEAAMTMRFHLQMQLLDRTSLLIPLRGLTSQI